MGWSGQNVIARLVIVEGENDGLFVYNGAPASGNLIASIASAAGEDQFGNSYPQGILSQLSGTGSVNMDAGVINFSPAVAPAIQAIIGAGTGYLTLTSPETVIGDFSALLRLRSQNESLGAGSSLAEVQAALALIDNNPAPGSVSGYTMLYSDPFTQLHTDRAFQTDVNVEAKNLGAPPGAGGAGSKFYSVSGFPQFQSGQNSIGGDTNAYDAARLTLPIAQQTVTSAGATLASMAVKDTVPYQFRGVLPYRGSVSAGTAGFAFTGPSVSSETAIYLNALSSAGFGNPGTVTLSINPQSSFGGTFTSPTLSTTDVNVLTVEGIVTFSAAGTLAWTCKANTAGDNVAIFPGWLTVMPVIA